jgi:hypothetical protein
MFCSDCQGNAGRKQKRRRWYVGAAAALLLLSGASFLYTEKNDWEFSWDALLGRPVAVINGEPVPRSEARERFRTARVMLQKEYGKELFAGEQGKLILADLEHDVMEKLVGERLVAQEASRMKIRVGDDRVRQEMQRIGREVYGNWENCQASLSEDGISQEYMMNHVRNLLLRQEVAKAKAPPEGDPDVCFGVWLNRERQNAKVTFDKTFRGVQASSPRGRTCCGSGNGL